MRYLEPDLSVCISCPILHSGQPRFDSFLKCAYFWIHMSFNPIAANNLFLEGYND